jgi:pyrroloquinoline quinone (PQQ) biosynthesis protein C
VTLYAIESAQPSLSRVKLEGLLEHYGFEEGPGTEYFSVHAWRDHEHAALAREAFEQVAFQEDPFALLGQVEAVYRSHWGLLDGLEQASRG